MRFTWSWAALFTRVIVGLNFGVPGVWKVSTVWSGQSQGFFMGRYLETWVPGWGLVVAGAALPFVELVAGWLLVLGLFRRPVAVTLGFVLVMLSYGHLLTDYLYSPYEHIFPRTLLLIPSWILSTEDDKWSLDYWRLRRRLKATPSSAPQA